MQNLQNYHPQRNGNPPCGGQATIGLFGLPGSSIRRHQPPTAPAPVQPKGPVPRQHDCARAVRLRQNNYEVFVRLAERERRPVDEVMAEWLADCAALIGRDELFEGSGFAMAPAMHRAARASDERERHCPVNDEHADYLHRCGGTGYVEITLAIES